MEQEPVSLGHDVQVVDPDVRGYVYSLVTAVCEIRDSCPCAFTDANCSLSSEGSMAKMQTDMCWEMTPWPVCAISSGG
jgi:hypothetical protein